MKLNKFKIFNKIFKKFKIILNINYSIKSNINLKTSLKSILNQSGILDALIAEERIDLLLEIFFYDLYSVLFKNNISKTSSLQNEKIFNKNIDNSQKNNDTATTFKNFSRFIQNIFLFEDCVDNPFEWIKNFKFRFNQANKKFHINMLEKSSNLVKFYTVYQDKVIDDEKNNISKEEEKEGYISEFKFLNLQFPLYIYMYKKELKNLFLICNLISTLLLKKLFLIFWKRRRRNFWKILWLLHEYYEKGFKWKYHINKNRFFFLKKFNFTILYIRVFFKLTLLKNFKYIYYNFFNYNNLKINLISIFGNFLSFYRYPEFKHRKINFRRKIRKNMFIENQYI